MHLEIISNLRPIKVRNDNIDISKSDSHNETIISPAGVRSHNILLRHFIVKLHLDVKECYRYMTAHVLGMNYS